MPQARITSQYVDSMMAARRVNDDHMQSLDGYTKETTRLGIAAKAEMDIVTRRRASNMARVQSEMKTQDIIETADIDAKNEERIHDQNGKLAKELERRRAEHERKEREIQRICEESEELKELERRLKVRGGARSCAPRRAVWSRCRHRVDLAAVPPVVLLQRRVASCRSVRIAPRHRAGPASPAPVSRTHPRSCAAPRRRRHPPPPAASLRSRT